MNRGRIIVSAFLVAVVAADVLISLQGDELCSRTPEMLYVNIGYQPDWYAADRSALRHLADVVAANPHKNLFEICWVDSAFFGWLGDNQFYLAYNKKTGSLIEAGNQSMRDDPEQEWRGVRAELLPGLAEKGFESRYLSNAGCHSLVD
jgi:hypothetical protein